MESRQLISDPGDEELLKLAVSQQRVVVTIDSDFGKLAFQNNAGHRGIIRLPDVTVPRRVELLNEVLAKHEQDIGKSAIITVRGRRIRVTYSHLQPPE